VPEADKRQHRENIEGWNKAFHQLVANRAANEVIAAACKRHLIQARESMKSYGCEF
jgi:DNA-binding GntR family transcriptional regulator